MSSDDRFAAALRWSAPLDRRAALLGALRAAGVLTLGGGASGALFGCGERTNPSAATDYLLELGAVDHAYASPPLGDLVRLVTQRAQERGVQPLLPPPSGGAYGSAPQDLGVFTADRAQADPATGRHPPTIGVAVAGPFEHAAIEPVAAAAARRGVKLISFLVDFEPRVAAITVDAARIGTALATDAARWAQRRLGGRGEVLLVGPSAADRANTGAFSLTAPTSERALRDMLARSAPGLEVVATVRAGAASTARALVTRALRASPGVRVVLCWNDGAAVGAARAVRALHPADRAGFYVGGQGTPALVERATLDELRRDDVLRAIVAARPRDLARALVDLPHDVLSGRPVRDIEISVATLTPGSAALLAHGRDYDRDPGATLSVLNAGQPTNLNPIEPS